PSALRALGPRLPPRAPVLLAMDGVGVLDAARGALPDHVAWIRAACDLVAREESPGKVTVEGPLAVSLAATGGALVAVRALEAALAGAGVATSVGFDARAVEWRRALPAIAVAAL